eukprot:3729186-Pleurochrysis_carterae.AAC.1
MRYLLVPLRAVRALQLCQLVQSRTKRCRARDRGVVARCSAQRTLRERHVLRPRAPESFLHGRQQPQRCVLRKPRPPGQAARVAAVGWVL